MSLALPILFESLFFMAHQQTVLASALAPGTGLSTGGPWHWPLACSISDLICFTLQGFIRVFTFDSIIRSMFCEVKHQNVSL